MTVSTKMLPGVLRTRLLDTDINAVSMADLLTGGLHFHAPPDNSVTPYGVLSVNGFGTGVLTDSDDEEQGTIELMLFGRGRGQIALLSDCGDLAEQVFYKWTTDQAGWLTIRSRESRSFLPPMPQPPNAEILRLRVLWRYTWWPAFRLQQTTPAGS